MQESQYDVVTPQHGPGTGQPGTKDVPIIPPPPPDPKSEPGDEDIAGGGTPTTAPDRHRQSTATEAE